MTNEAQEMFDCIFTRPFAEDAVTLNEFVDDLIRHLSWRLFRHQNEICFNISEKNPPMLKENAITYMQNALNAELSWVRKYVICRMLIEYRIANIDLGEEAEWYLHEEFEDEEWEALNQAINRYIWNDYASVLGAESARAYFERIGKPEYIMED